LTGTSQTLIYRRFNDEEERYATLTPGGERFDDSADVVADQAELGGPAFFLHRSSQRRLGVTGHGVGLVEDDDFERRAWTAVGSAAADGLLSEVFHFFTNDLVKKIIM
jgi:hypothetical protein